MQTLRPHLNPQNQNVHFNRVPRRVVCTLQFEKPWWRQCGALNSLFLNPVLPPSEKSWPHHPRDMRKTQIGLHQLCTLLLCIVSYRCCNKLPQTQWLKTTQSYSSVGQKSGGLYWFLSFRSLKAKIKVSVGLGSGGEATSRLLQVVGRIPFHVLVGLRSCFLAGHRPGVKLRS